MADLMQTQAEEGVVLFQIVPAGCMVSPNSETVTTLKMTSRGRITIPKVVRSQFGLKGGETIVYMEQDDGSFIARLVR